MPTLGPADFDALRKIDAGEPQTISSHHVVRLEMRGLVKNDPSGLRLTEAGRRVLRDGPVPSPEKAGPPEEPARDALGRRLGRRSPGSKRSSPI